MNVQIQILVDNDMPQPFASEHGLSLAITCGKEKILFDTGAGSALMKNLQQHQIDPAVFTKIILSHGHFDHTGGLGEILPLTPDAELYYAPGITTKRFSRHPERPVKELSMPESSCKALELHEKKFEISRFTQIAEGIFLTGPIPRLSGEDCGGPFFLDQDGTDPDHIQDEMALVFSSGDLIQGCCHAGIINTVNYCKQCIPEIKIKTITGGLHLLHASPARQEQTAAFLRQLDLQNLTALHCTGAGLSL